MVEWTSRCSERLARELHDVTGDRWSHVQAVALKVRRIAPSVVDGDALLSAAWLHDIGYAPELVDTGMHAVDGAAFLDRAGVPSEVVSLVAFHTGAEYEAEERSLLDRLLQFDRPHQEALDLLILADLLSGPAGERLTVAKRLDEITQRYEPQHPVHRAIIRSRRYLEQCASRAASSLDHPM